MPTLVNDFSGGVSGAAVTTANSGGASGTAFDAVVTGIGSTVKYAASPVYMSALSCACTALPLGSAYVQWSTSLAGTGVTQVWYRAYCYLQNSTQTIPLVQFFGTSLILAATIVVTGTVIQVLDALGVLQVQPSVTLPVGQWFRIEGYITGSGLTGQAEVKTFLTPNSPAADNTTTTGTTLNTLGLLTTVRLGITGNSSITNTTSMNLAGIGASTSAYLGPLGLRTSSGGLQSTRKMTATGVNTPPARSSSGAVTLKKSPALSGVSANTPPARSSAGAITLKYTSALSGSALNTPPARTATGAVNLKSASALAGAISNTPPAVSGVGSIAARMRAASAGAVLTPVTSTGGFSISGGNVTIAGVAHAGSVFNAGDDVDPSAGWGTGTGTLMAAGPQVMHPDVPHMGSWRCKHTVIPVMVTAKIV